MEIHNQLKLSILLIFSVARVTKYWLKLCSGDVRFLFTRCSFLIVLPNYYLLVILLKTKSCIVVITGMAKIISYICFFLFIFSLWELFHTPIIVDYVWKFPMLKFDWVLNLSLQHLLAILLGVSRILRCRMYDLMETMIWSDLPKCSNVVVSLPLVRFYTGIKSRIVSVLVGYLV